MRILFIRGAFLNKFEGQNYEPLARDHQIVGIGSLTSIHKKFDFPVKLFFSPYDIGSKIGQINQIGSIGERLMKGFFNRLLGDSHFLFGLEKFVKSQVFQSFNQMKQRYDIAHIAETYYGYDLQAVRLKKQGFIKRIVSTCWETIAFNNEKIGKKKRIKEIVKKNTDFFLCPTERAKLSLITEGITDSKIRIVRVGVDLSRFKYQKLNIKYQKYKSNIKNNLIILFVGRLVEEKGVMELYEAFKNIKHETCNMKHKNTKIKLKIIGEGNLKEKLINKIKKDKLEENVSIEKKSYQEMPKAYQEADILVVPSRTSKTWEEQYGMILVEAMASGLPVVAFRSGAIFEVLGNVGILVDEGDVDNLTKTIFTLINNNDLRIKLGKMGRERVEKEFDREKISKKIERIYKELLYC